MEASRVPVGFRWYACWRHYPGRTSWVVARFDPNSQRPSPLFKRVGSCIARFEACSTFTRVPACVLAKSPKATLYTGVLPMAILSIAPIATGWSDQLPGGNLTH
jgi:hypothetical protein